MSDLADTVQAAHALTGFGAQGRQFTLTVFGAQGRRFALTRFGAKDARR